jgi:hypothetical protein
MKHKELNEEETIGALKGGRSSETMRKKTTNKKTSNTLSYLE